MLDEPLSLPGFGSVTSSNPPTSPSLSSSSSKSSPPPPPKRSSSCKILEQAAALYLSKETSSLTLAQNSGGEKSIVAAHPKSLPTTGLTTKSTTGFHENAPQEITQGVNLQQQQHHTDDNPSSVSVSSQTSSMLTRFTNQASSQVQITPVPEAFRRASRAPSETLIGGLSSGISSTSAASSHRSSLCSNNQVPPSPAPGRGSPVNKLTSSRASLLQKRRNLLRLSRSEAALKSTFLGKQQFQKIS